MQERRGFLSILLNILTSVSKRITVDGSGNIVEEDREVSGFTGLALAGVGNLIIEVGAEEALRIEADDNLMEYFETEVRDGTLKIGIQQGVNLKPTQPVHFYVTVKQLNTITLSGSGKIEAPELEAEQFHLKISGSGNAKVAALSANTLDVKISGSGKMNISGGHTEEQNIVISGSGNYDAGSMRSGSVKVRISGSGNVTLWADESLDVRTSGSGSVGYYGNPKVTSSRTGSGKVRSLGDPQ